MPARSDVDIVSLVVQYAIWSSRHVSNVFSELITVNAAPNIATKPASYGNSNRRGRTLLQVFAENIDVYLAGCDDVQSL